jgi:hypothetical protein
VPSFWIDLHALSDGPHTIALEVTDTWGFVGVATKTFTRERTAPSCTLSAAQDAADWTKIRFTVWAQDLGAGLQTLDFQVDGSTVKYKPMAGFPQTYTWISGTSSLPAGLHKVRAVCTDAQGNRTTTSEVGVAIYQQCNTTAVAGGNVMDERVVSMGKPNGTTTLKYRTWGVHDRIRVYNEAGALLTDTGCVATGDPGAYAYRAVTFANSPTLRIRVYPNCNPGTAQPTTEWDYSLSCPP